MGKANSQTNPKSTNNKFWQFLDGLLGPDTGIHIACLPAQEVGGHFVEERAGTAADIEDLVVVGDVEHLTEERVGLGHHVLEILRPVRNRKQGKARTVEIYDSFCCVLDDFVCEDLFSLYVLP